MKFTDLICCYGCLRKQGLTQDELNALTDPTARTTPFMQELCTNLKQNSVKTQQFFKDRHYNDFYRQSGDISSFMYADILASPENRNYAIKLAEKYQKGDLDAKDIIDTLGSHIEKIAHPGFQERIQAKRLADEVNATNSVTETSRLLGRVLI